MFNNDNDNLTKLTADGVQEPQVAFYHSEAHRGLWVAELNTHCY